MVRTIKLASLAAVLLLVLLAVPLWSTNMIRASTCLQDAWVAPPPLGNDANPGTQAQPFATIQKGINEVCGSGTVHVAAGIYYDNPTINMGQNLVGAGAPVTIIDGSNCGTVLTISSVPSPNTISGFTIRNGNVALVEYGDPQKEQVLYAGIKLPSFKISPSHFGAVTCGGGIYIGDTHTVTLNDCTIKDNNAEEGGGICNYGQLYMNRCTVSGNTALARGGGIYNNHSSSMWLTNCTISGNSAANLLAYHQRTPPFWASIVNASPISGYGGGIYNSGTMELLNCTIANNSAYGYGGGFVNVAPDTAIFKNTIVANNTAGEPGTNNGYNPPPAVITSLGHNLDSENSCGFNQAGDLINTNPDLGPLQDNDGPTYTHALLEGSRAIDAGDNDGAPDTDQRDVIRPQGLYVDIGAYELVKTVVPTLPELPRYSPPMPNWTRLNPATISVQFVSVSPQQATANEPVTISTNVVNTGDESGNYNVALKINGQVEQTRMVGVGPQATQPIKFTVTRAQPGTYSVDIDGQKGSFTIPDTGGTARAPASGGLIAFLIIGVLILTAAMVLVLSRRTA